MANLLGRQCEGQVARSLELVKGELSRVAEYLGEGSEVKEIDAMKTVIRLMTLEAVIRHVAAHCVGVEN
jgi:sirohydrochlorin ferrochelatase